MIVAENAPRDPQLSLTNLLAYGHRGYISYSEDELCKLFDKVLTKKQEEIAERRIKLTNEMKNSNGMAKWKVDSLEKELKSLEECVAKLQTIADQVFEERFLL